MRKSKTNNPITFNSLSILFYSKKNSYIKFCNFDQKYSWDRYPCFCFWNRIDLKPNLTVIKRRGNRSIELACLWSKTSSSSSNFKIVYSMYMKVCTAAYVWVCMLWKFFRNFFLYDIGLHFSIQTTFHMATWLNNVHISKRNRVLLVFYNLETMALQLCKMFDAFYIYY